MRTLFETGTLKCKLGGMTDASKGEEREVRSVHSNQPRSDKMGAGAVGGAYCTHSWSKWSMNPWREWIGLSTDPS